MEIYYKIVRRVWSPEASELTHKAGVKHQRRCQLFNLHAFMCKHPLNFHPLAGMYFVSVISILMGLMQSDKFGSKLMMLLSLVG